MILQQTSIKRNRLDLLNWTGGQQQVLQCDSSGANKLPNPQQAHRAQVPVHSAVYRVMVPSTLVYGYRRFGGAYTLKVEVHDARKCRHPPIKSHGANLHRCKKKKKKTQILCVNFYFQLLRTFLGGSRLIKCTYPKIRGMNSRTGYSVRDSISYAGRSVGYPYNLQEQQSHSQSLYKANCLPQQKGFKHLHGARYPYCNN